MMMISKPPTTPLRQQKFDALPSSAQTPTPPPIEDPSVPYNTPPPQPGRIRPPPYCRKIPIPAIMKTLTIPSLEKLSPHA